MADHLETWDLWLPGPGATGLPFARSRINAKDAGDRVLVHAAPQRLQVTVTDAVRHWPGGAPPRRGGRNLEDLVERRRPQGMALAARVLQPDSILRVDD